MRWFFSITNALAGNLFSFFTKPIVEKGAKGFKTIANKIQEYRLDENRWNPEPKEGEYHPIFIPDGYAKRMEKAYLHQEHANPNENIKAQRNIIAQISKNFFDELSHTKSFALETLKETKQYLPTILYNKLQSIVNYVFKQIDSIEKAISDPFAALGQLIYKKQKIVNAFLCGVYNSIIDIIAGIFSLVAFIFEAVYTIEDVKDQTLIYAEMLVELFENMAEGILNFNFAEFFFNWITFEIKTLFRLINFIETLAKTSLEKYAYYYGYIVGIVIDIIIETLLTGGAAAVEKLLQSVETFLRNPLQKIAKTIEKSAIFVENVLQKIINFIDFLAKKLKKGATELFKDVEKLLDEIFESSEAYLDRREKFGEEVADHAMTPSEKRYKDKLKAQAKRIEERKARPKRKQIYRKYASKFDRGFFNHLEGEFNTKIFTSRTGINKSEALVSQGGHSSEAIGKSLKLKGNPIPDPIIDDLPYKSKIEIKYRDGFIEKEAISSMFPRNWNMKRIQEEVAFVYDNTVAKGKGLKGNKNGISDFEGLSTNGFQIKIQIKDGNIINAYPINF